MLNIYYTYWNSRNIKCGIKAVGLLTQTSYNVTILNSDNIIKNVENMKFLYRRMKKTGMTGGMQGEY